MRTDWKKQTALFLASQSISLFGTSLVQYAITWYITLRTQSGVAVTVSIICGFLPTFLVSPFAGVWADRYPRKTLIIVSDTLIAVATLILALLFRAGHQDLWLLFVASAVRAFGSAVQSPAVRAILPQFVPEDKLMKVNATNSSIHSAVSLVSPMVSGALLTWAGIGSVFMVDVVTAAIAVVILAFALKVPAHAKASAPRSGSYLDDLRTGLSYVKNESYLMRFFGHNIVFLFLVTPLAFLTPLQVARSFGGDVWRLTAIEIAFSGGMILGGIGMAVWGGLRNRVHTMVLSNFSIGILTVALGLVPFFWVYLGLMAVCGMSLPVFHAPSTVILQQRVEDDFRGRVFGLLGMISGSMMPLGMLLFGPLADAVKIEWLLLGTGLLISVQALVMLGDKVLVSAGIPPTESA